MGTLVTTVAATEYPVDIAEARQQCRLVDDTTRDDDLAMYIRSAVKEVEAYTGMALASRTLRYDLDGFPCGDIILPVYPVQSITSVAYDDDSNVAQTYSSANYYTMLNGAGPYLRPVTTWPTTYQDKPARVRITFLAGYADIDNVPDDVRFAILYRVWQKFEGVENPEDWQRLAAPYRLYKV